MNPDDRHEEKMPESRRNIAPRSEEHPETTAALLELMAIVLGE